MLKRISPIQLNFEAYVDLTPAAFYSYLIKDIRREIERVFEKRDITPFERLSQFFDGTEVTDHLSMRNFFPATASFSDTP